MISDQPPPSVQGEIDEPPREASVDLVVNLYRGLLDRDPSADEIAFYIDHLMAGVSVAELVNGIAESEEACLVRSRRHGSNLSELPQDERPLAPLAVRADDVLQVLAQAMTFATGSEPSFDEVMQKFNEFRLGTDLAEILRAALPAAASAMPLASVETLDEIEAVVRTLYRDCLRRIPAPVEIDIWQKQFLKSGRVSDLVIAIGESEEARLVRTTNDAGLSHALLVQMAFEIVAGRGASAYEVDVFRDRMEREALSASDLVMSFFDSEARKRLSADVFANNPDQAYLFGSRGLIDSTEWLVPQDASRKPHHDILGAGSLFCMDRSDGCAVSIITSLYRGGEFIRSFLENITAQTIFRDHCELIIIDAFSPENEGETIAEFQKTFPNIVYHRFSSRIGIYEAWNIAARLAKGRYLTNANLDDIRRADSLEIQAAVLDSLPFTDVAYQDVLYSFKPRISFEEIEAHNLRTDLPIISHYNLMEFNSPHNGPMWRKSLHDQVGYFNETLKSAADFEFWVRCHIAGKGFYKSNEAHIAYYVNPKGLSTRPDTRGVEESNAISKAKYRQIVSPLLTASKEEFIRIIEEVAEVRVSTGRRYDVLQSALCALGGTSRSPMPRAVS